MTNRAKTYPEYLRSPHWQDLKRRALKRDRHHCQLCNDTETVLHVHHKFYRDSWYDTKIGDLITLCARCHLAFHAPTRFLEARWWAKPWLFLVMLWRVTR